MTRIGVTKPSHSASSRQTWPLDAERRHSSVVPKTTSKPRLVGAYQAHFAESVMTAPSTSPRIGVTYVQVSVTTVTPELASSSPPSPSASRFAREVFT